MLTGAPAPSTSGPTKAGGKAGRGAGAAPRRGATAPAELTNSVQQERLRDSIEHLDVRLAALKCKMKGRWAGRSG